jgi:hypothetical protein
VKQKDIDMDSFLAEYAQLKSTCESLQQVVQRLSSVQ